MPELPDIELYLSALRPRVEGETLERVRLISPFLLRSVEPPITSTEGRRVIGLRRLGKRIVLALDGDLFLVLHLMIAGRLQWKPRGAKPPGRRGLAAFDFSSGTLILTEAGSKRRASLYVADGETGLAEHDRGGIEVLEADLEAFRSALTRKSHTLKRALTDPGIFSGIGNAYSDEILHRARLSPFQRSRNLSAEDSARLFDATRAILEEWSRRLRDQIGDGDGDGDGGGWPKKVTAFHPEMAVHGRHGKPCPDCGAPVQRIVYAENESNYCARCQTGGKVLADRALSRLLKDDWPRTLEELEERLPGRSG